MSSRHNFLSDCENSSVTDRQIHRQIYRIDRQSEDQSDRDIQTDSQRQRHRQTNSQTNIDKYSHRLWQKDGVRHGQTYRQRQYYMITWLQMINWSSNVTIIKKNQNPFRKSTNFTSKYMMNMLYIIYLKKVNMWRVITEITLNLAHAITLKAWNEIKINIYLPSVNPFKNCSSAMDAKNIYFFMQELFVICEDIGANNLYLYISNMYTILISAQHLKGIK